MLVMKFGGTSVEDSTAIARIADIVKRRLSHRPIVVVSAMAKVTDQLVAMGNSAAAGDAEAALAILCGIRDRHFKAADELLGHAADELKPRLQARLDALDEFIRGVAAVRELSPRSSDCLLSYGELLSSELVAAAFAASGLDSVWVDSRECVVTDSSFTKAVPLYDETRERLNVTVKPIVDRDRVPVMGGFIAATKDGVTTTLGRGGSDFSAAIIGAALRASSIEIWTDVEGIMTTDPRLCPEARCIRRISFQEAAELAFFGAKVLHPATLLPAIQEDIPVYVLNSRDPKSKGTRITLHAPRGRDLFRAITAKTGVSIVSVAATRGQMAHGFLKKVFDILDRHGCSADLVAISEVTLSFTVDSKRFPAAIVAELQQLADVTCENQQAIVCLVGEDIHGRPGIAGQVFTTVAQAGVNIRMISQGASEINISFVIADADVPRAVQSLHQHFFAATLPGKQDATPKASARKPKLAQAAKTSS